MPAAYVVTSSGRPIGVALTPTEAEGYAMSLATSYQQATGCGFRWQPHPADGRRLMVRGAAHGARWRWSLYAVRTVPTVGEGPVPDLDLDAIRADLAEATDWMGDGGDHLEHRCTATCRCVSHAEDLLAAVVALSAELTRLRVVVAEHDGGPEARPRINTYRIERRDPGEHAWDYSPYTFETADDALDAVARLRAASGAQGEFRVVRVRRSYTVVATEDEHVAPEAPEPLQRAAPHGTPAKPSH